MLETGKLGPTTASTPSLARRCTPSLRASLSIPCRTDGGHSIHLRELGRRGRRLHGPLETIDDHDITLSERPQRLATVDPCLTNGP